jgi:hypothetical protein
MSGHKRRLAKLLALPVLAACGFLIAGTLAGVGAAHETTTTTTTTPPPAGEGCTPGYWKNHPESWPATGFSTGMMLESVFDVPDSLGLDSKTLLAALQTGGGGVNALLRHAVAALLNSAHPSVDYDLTTAEVIAMTNTALASGDYEATKDIFEGLNEQSAPGFCD